MKNNPLKDAEKWKEAGKMASEVLNYISQYKIKRGANLLAVCEEGESLIRKKGGLPAFPINISINEIAAHFTPPPFSTEKIPNNAFVKVDVGVHIDGYIGDTAKTIYIGPRNKISSQLLKAGEEVLLAGIDVIRDGIRVGEITKAIHNKAKELGYGVLVDLNGHSIERYNLHSGITVPNSTLALSMFGLSKGPKIVKGMVIAIEPFLVATKSDSSTIEDRRKIFIFSLNDKGEGIAYKKLYKIYGKLPFALRWIVKKRSQLKSVIKILNQLIRKGYLRGYPTLIEKRGNIVVQFEHTVLVKNSSAEVLTVSN